MGNSDAMKKEAITSILKYTIDQNQYSSCLEKQIKKNVIDEAAVIADFICYSSELSNRNI